MTKISYDSFHKRFFSKLAAIAEERELLDKDIAAGLGTTKSRFSRIKSGEKQFTIPMLANAVVSLGIDANEVLTATQKRHLTTKKK